jgi:cathepsin X
MATCLVFGGLLASSHPSSVWSRDRVEATGYVWRGNSSGSDLPGALRAELLPRAFSWCERGMCTISRNQHLPQYCGSCWAHGALSALGDRIKIARQGCGVDINLAVQHLLNCGDAGSCYGGSVDALYQWLHRRSSSGTGVAYETEQPYLACSSDSKHGLCPYASWDCRPENVARTCSTFPEEGGACTGLAAYPNATISAYGSVAGADAMKLEVYRRGPVACGIDADPLLRYEGGIIEDGGRAVNHVVSVVGWGDDGRGQYWLVRNSWGEYWGEMGFARVRLGANALRIESQCNWATPGSWTEVNVPCTEEGAC